MTGRNVHYAANPKDRGAWGSLSACGKKKPLTSKREKVTCVKCISQVEWDMERYDRACASPLYVGR